MDVIQIHLQGNADRFDQDNYAVPSGEIFAMEITNASAAPSGEPFRATVAISRAGDPALFTDPTRPHMWYYDASKAIFVAPSVLSPATRTVEVPALEPGRYVLQNIDSVTHPAHAAVLIVGS